MSLPITIRAAEGPAREQVIQDLQSAFPDGNAKTNWLGDIALREGSDLFVFISIRGEKIKIHARPSLLACIFSGLCAGNPVIEPVKTGEYQAKLEAAQKYAEWLMQHYGIAEQPSEPYK